MKNYTFNLNDGKLDILSNGKPIFKNVKIRLNVTCSGNVYYAPKELVLDGDDETVIFTRERTRTWEAEALSVSLSLKNKDGLLSLLVEAQLKSTLSMCYAYYFEPVNSLGVEFDFVGVDKITANDMDNPFWSSVVFANEYSGIGAKVDSLLAKCEDTHYAILPLVNKNSSARMNAKGIYLTISKAGVTHIKTDVLVMSSASSAYEAVDKLFVLAKKNGFIDVALRNERELSKIFNGFGWCTWDAFYNDVSSKKLYEKLDELKSKGVKLKWLLIDDGWSQYLPVADNDGKLLYSFKEDVKKFPEGLKACISKIKKDYGVEYVGVWQAMTGYWNGVAKNGEIAKELPDALTKLYDGRLAISFDEQKAFKFWDTWHAYLKEQGVDFVKVDNQGSVNFRFLYQKTIGEGLKSQYQALEKSVFKHFDGAIINCMASSLENALCRPKSALNRNSDDFRPNNEVGFSQHLTQNAYSSIILGRIHHLDFDMWWSMHPTAKESSVLRAVSGGPVYVSDEIGKTDPTYIKPIVDANGEIYPLDDYARPTIDCIYTDCKSELKPLKIFNTIKDKFVVACYNVSEESSVEGTLSLSDITDIDGEYLAYEYFTKKFYLLNKNKSIPIKISGGEVALFNIYPITDNKISLGDMEKYISISTPVGRVCDIKDLKIYN